MAKKDQGAAPENVPVAASHEEKPAAQPQENASLNQCNAQLFALLLNKTEGA